MSNIELKKANQMAAIDLMIHNPDLNKKQLAEQINVSHRTIQSWFADDRFVDMYYKKYMVSFNAKLPMVLNSMIREAVEGNVQAGRLVLEHSGKLVKNINVTVDSPFEKFLKAEQIDAEDIIDAESEEVAEIIETLPERNPQNDKPKKRQIKEKKAVERIKEGNPAAPSSDLVSQAKTQIGGYATKHAKQEGVAPGRESTQWIKNTKND